MMLLTLMILLTMLIESQQESYQTHNLRNLLFMRNVGSLTENRNFYKIHVKHDD